MNDDMLVMVYRPRKVGHKSKVSQTPKVAEDNVTGAKCPYAECQFRRTNLVFDNGIKYKKLKNWVAQYLQWLWRLRQTHCCSFEFNE